MPPSSVAVPVGWESRRKARYRYAASGRPRLTVHARGGSTSSSPPTSFEREELGPTVASDEGDSGVTRRAPLQARVNSPIRPVDSGSPRRCSGEVVDGLAWNAYSGRLRVVNPLHVVPIEKRPADVEGLDVPDVLARDVPPTGDLRCGPAVERRSEDRLGRGRPGPPPRGGDGLELGRPRRMPEPHDLLRRSIDHRRGLDVSQSAFRA